MTLKLSFMDHWRRRYREFAIIAQDPVLWMSLLFCAIFLFIFVFYPILRTASNGFFTSEGQFSLEHFARYFDSYFGPLYRRVFTNTLLMGGLAATVGTLVGFIFAYTVVRCNPPGKGLIHTLALVPTVSPPFAIALSTVLLFGRNGLITHRWLGMTFPQGSNDIYGMDGLVFVQTITFFSAAYLILRAMLERLDPSMEEAAESMGANRFHIFRTVTLPLLIPGLAGAFLLLFVESLADLGNPLFISGNVTVLATQIFLAVAGEYDYQKASTLSLVLLIPTLIVFLLQRYYVTRRSYVSVTGKPSGGHVVEKEPWIRWPFVVVTYLVCALIILLYLAIIYGSFCRTWGVDFSLTLEWWRLMLTRGIEAILDTTFLSLLATPFAVLIGMIIAFLVVRKQFSGKGALDFVSNLGGAVPGTILGIGFVLAFSTPPMIVVVLLYVVLALFLGCTLFHEKRQQLIVLLLGSAVGIGLSFLDDILGLTGLYDLLGGAVVAAGLYLWLKLGQARGRIWVGIGAYLLAYNLVEFVAMPIATLSRSLPRGFWSNAIFQLADHIKVLFQLPPTLMTIVLIFAGVLLIQPEKGRVRLLLATFILAVTAALSFTAMPLTLVGTPFIILMAYAVRSLPASVRSGVAALQQIDPAIEEASNSLGADTQYTFRKITLPLILPALLAGMIFSFTRHMTSVSAIIFLVSARWRIVTAAIMSEWEQGGISIAAAYSTTIILFVLIAIGGLYFVTNRMLRSREYGVRDVSPSIE
ncbi:MAG TPA: iron ABC transporter permease [Anaerolineae bacterium]|nr:iron ABC transporter permease [Anaerolineae bacterium]HQH39007.1 iron ABC transporter permease [Anaerolineae bacterium]